MTAHPSPTDHHGGAPHLRRSLSLIPGFSRLALPQQRRDTCCPGSPGPRLAGWRSHDCTCRARFSQEERRRALRLGRQCHQGGYDELVRERRARTRIEPESVSRVRLGHCRCPGENETDLCSQQRTRLRLSGTTSRVGCRCPVATIRCADSQAGRIPRPRALPSRRCPAPTALPA